MHRQPLQHLTPSQANQRCASCPADKDKGQGRVPKKNRVRFALTVASPKPSAGKSRFVLLCSVLEHTQVIVPVAAFLEKMTTARSCLPGPKKAAFPPRLNVLVDRTKEMAWLSYLQVRNYLAAEFEIREKLCLPTTPLYSGIGKTALAKLVQTTLQTSTTTQNLVVQMVLDSLAGSVTEEEVRAALQDFMDATYVLVELPRVADDSCFSFYLRQAIFLKLGGTAPAFLKIEPSPHICSVTDMLANITHANQTSYFVHFDELDLPESQAVIFIQFAFDNFLNCLNPRYRYIFCTGHSATLLKQAIDTLASPTNPPALPNSFPSPRSPKEAFSISSCTCAVAVTEAAAAAVMVLVLA